MIEFDVNHIKIATGSHQANGQIVRVNRSLAKLLESEKCIYWDTVRCCVSFNTCSTLFITIKQTLGKVLFDLEQIVDELKIKLKEFDNTKEDRDLEKIKSEAKMKK